MSLSLSATSQDCCQVVSLESLCVTCHMVTIWHELNATWPIGESDHSNDHFQWFLVFLVPTNPAPKTNQSRVESKSISSFYPSVSLLIRRESVWMEAHSLDVQAISFVQWAQSTSCRGWVGGCVSAFVHVCTQSLDGVSSIYARGRDLNLQGRSNCIFLFFAFPPLPIRSLVSLLRACARSALPGICYSSSRFTSSDTLNKLHSILHKLVLIKSNL